jgi:hypothetical protein
MIARRKERIVFICDECQGELETNELEREEALKIAKEHNWKNLKKEYLPSNGPKLRQGVNWANICKDCYEEY